MLKLTSTITVLGLAVFSTTAIAGYNCMIVNKYPSSSYRSMFTEAQNCKSPAPKAVKRIKEFEKKGMTATMWVYCGGKHKSCMREKESILKFSQKYYGYLPMQWNGKHIPAEVLKNSNNRKYIPPIKPGTCLFAQSRKGSMKVRFNIAPCNHSRKAPKQVIKNAQKGMLTMWIRCVDKSCQKEKSAITKYLQVNSGKLPMYLKK